MKKHIHIQNQTIKNQMTKKDTFTNKEIAFLLNALRDMYDSATTVNERCIIRMSFRNALYVISESRSADYVSNSAQGIWEKSGIKGDLHNLLVNQKRTIQKNIPVLKDLLLEHCVPLSELFRLFMVERKSIKYIMDNLKTAWITKTENTTLNKKYRSKRMNWEKCYIECGIKLDK